jgi:hypothetical protein
MRLVGPQSRFGHGSEEKSSQPQPGLEPAIIQPVTQRCATELSQLHPVIITNELKEQLGVMAVSSSLVAGTPLQLHKF